MRIFTVCLIAGSGLLCALSSSLAQSVTVSASPSVITNEGDESTLTFTISPPASRNLALNYVLTGSAAPGADYTLEGTFTRSGQIFVPAGQSTVTVTLHTFFDDDPFASEFAVFSLVHGRHYSVGFPSRARVDIENVKP
jgi:hypothetical protein